MLCHLRSYLAGISVDCLLAAQDHIERAELSGNGRQNIARRQRIRASEFAISDEVGVIYAHRQRVAENALRLRRAHCNHRHTSVGHLLEL